MIIRQFMDEQNKLIVEHSPTMIEIVNERMRRLRSQLPDTSNDIAFEDRLFPTIEVLGSRNEGDVFLSIQQGRFVTINKFRRSYGLPDGLIKRDVFEGRGDSGHNGCMWVIA